MRYIFLLLASLLSAQGNQGTGSNDTAIVHFIINDGNGYKVSDVKMGNNYLTHSAPFDESFPMSRGKYMVIWTTTTSDGTKNPNNNFTFDTTRSFIAGIEIRINGNKATSKNLSRNQLHR